MNLIWFLMRASWRIVLFAALLGAVSGFASVALLAIILNLMLHFIVIKPLRIVSAKADEVSLGNLNVEELQIKGNDEVASLGRSFNRMHRSLANALKMLDEED